MGVMVLRAQPPAGTLAPLLLIRVPADTYWEAVGNGCSAQALAAHERDLVGIQSLPGPALAVVKAGAGAGCVVCLPLGSSSSKAGCWFCVF